MLCPVQDKPQIDNEVRTEHHRVEQRIGCPADQVADTGQDQESGESQCMFVA